MMKWQNILIFEDSVDAVLKKNRIFSSFIEW